MKLGLRTCIYRVDDLADAKSWYSEAFNTKPYFDEDFYIGFNIGGYELGLLPVEEKKQQRGDSVMCYWGVEDIRKDFNRLLKLGAKKHEEPKNVGGELEVASLYDPWGNVFGLIYNPYFTLE